MEFFEWFFVPEMVLEYAGANISMGMFYGLIFGLPAALTVLCLLFSGIGLMTMANKAGVKHGWLGFLPFGNTWLSGKLAGESNIFGSKMKRPEIWATLVEALYVAVSAFSIVLAVLLSNEQFYEVVDGQFEFNISLVPVGMRWMNTASLILEIVGYILNFALIFFFWVLYVALFRKYYAKSPFLMTVLCAVFPFRGFVLFSVRNNKPIDYNAYMQQRMREYAARQGQYGGYNGGYNGGGYNGGSVDGTGQRPPEEPFSDFGGSSGNATRGEPQSTDHGNSGGGSGNDSPFSDF